MIRFLIVFSLTLALAGPAAALPMPWKLPAPSRPATIAFPHRAAPVPQPAPRRVAAASGEQELLLTPQSKVFLNGRPCSYEDVPDGAIIASAEVAEDGKTILSIYFERK